MVKESVVDSEWRQWCKKSRKHWLSLLHTNRSLLLAHSVIIIHDVPKDVSFGTAI